MAKAPRKPPAKRKSDALPDRVVSGRAPRSDTRQVELNLTQMPAWVEPCLPKLSDKVPTGDQWLYEIKWDGYRVSVYVAAGEAKIRTRNGHEWTKRFPLVAAGAGALPVDSAVIDGEVVMLDAQGRSRFADLHAAAPGGYAPEAVLYAFDLLWLNGEDLRDRPLSDRRLELEAIGLGAGGIYLSEEFAGDGEAFFREACRLDLEGIVAKRRDSKYRSGRRDEWQKIKCVRSAEFVVIGYMPSTTPGAIASLLVAQREGETLRYAGAVGTGYSADVATALRQGLDAIAVKTAPIEGLKIKGAVWASPQLIAEVAFRGWSAGGELRHASFKGLTSV